MKNINEMSKRALTLLLAFIMVVTLVPLNLLVVAEDGIIGSMVRIVSDTLYMYREAGESAVSHSKNELPETLVVLDTLADTFVVTEDYAVADGAVGENLDAPIPGFKPLFYDPETIISGDGTTVVDIYYDREYYLVDFDLKAPGGTGYGVVPMYVRYDTQVLIGTPTNPGYTFQEWELIRVYTVNSDTKVETDIVDGTITGPYDVKNGGSLVTVRHNLKYKAVWQVATTSYTIAYWLEDPEYVDPADPNDVKINEKYKIWGTRNITNVTTDTVVDGPAAGDVPAAWVQQNNVRIKSDSTETRNINLLNYLDFVSSDQDVKVQGDGSTVVNVYYDRKEYTLKFYYARSTRSNNRTTWYVAGQTDAGTSLFSQEVMMN